MLLRLLAVSWLALVPAKAAEQSAPAGDPISGKWGQGQTTLMDLSFDGSRTLSGTVFFINPAGKTAVPVRNGTFDRATGTLKIRGDVKRPDTGVEAVFVLDGKLDGETLAMTYTIGAEKGTMSLARISDAPGAESKPRPATEPLAASRKHFAEVSALILKAAELVPVDKYGYRPAPTVRTFGQLIAHVTDSYVYFCGAAAGKKLEWSDANEKGAGAKAALIANLKNATSGCAAVFNGGGDAEALIGNIAHANLHYGNVITYMRMLGLVPPSS